MNKVGGRDAWSIWEDCSYCCRLLFITQLRCGYIKHLWHDVCLWNSGSKWGTVALWQPSAFNHVTVKHYLSMITTHFFWTTSTVASISPPLPACYLQRACSLGAKWDVNGERAGGRDGVILCSLSICSWVLSSCQQWLGWVESLHTSVEPGRLLSCRAYFETPLKVNWKRVQIKILSCLGPINWIVLDGRDNATLYALPLSSLFYCLPSLSVLDCGILTSIGTLSPLSILVAHWLIQVWDTQRHFADGNLLEPNIVYCSALSVLLW